MEQPSFAVVASVLLIGTEAAMMLLGVFCVVSGIIMALGARRSPSYRAILEMFGGALFLVGLGCAAADLVMVS